MDPEKFDLVVLGSGEAGKFLAWTLAKEGKKVAVIERRYIGGSCPNIACLPSKNVIHSAKVASLFGRAAEFGIHTGSWHVDMKGVRERKRRMVDGLTDLHLANFEKSGATLIMGSGRFVGPKVLEVTDSHGATRLLTGDRIVVNTGSRAAVADIPGLVHAKPLTHIEALELDVVPEHLIVLGGGYVGLELSQAFRRLCSRVTIIERNSHLIHQEDEDISDAVGELFKDDGIEVLTSTQVTHVEGHSGSAVSVRVASGGQDRIIHGSHILAAAGRIPNTADIGLDIAGVELTERGFVRVDERLQTTALDVWAVGDCAGSPQFTHIGFDDFRVVRDNWEGKDHTTTGRQVPFCVFTDPEVSRIGLNEKQARARGIRYRVARLPMAAVLRTRTLSETRGFIKVLVEADGDLILGSTVFGVEASAILSTVQVAMLAGLPYTALRDAVFAHPTVAEGLVSIFSSIPPR
jgi:pyruvate/2-oxoglutarate dehydrogenase complex dihydrolipoamide dehydrogenase (E3) component